MFLRVILYIGAASLLALVVTRLVVSLHVRTRIFSVEDAPSKPVAIVFGAGLRRDGQPTSVLQDRVATAAELYFDGKVEVLLMSGDNRYVDYNEPNAMKEYAVSLGVPEEDIVLDFAGRRTYDTCYRAQAIFGVEEAILVTQRYHLPRALYTCNTLGLPSVGVAADQRSYRQAALAYWNLREWAATLTAFWDLYLAKPTPVLGDPEPIFPR